MKTPVVLVIYKRPHLVQSQVRRLRKQKPAALYIMADGPASRAEIEKTILCRRAIEKVDWDCDVRIRAAVKNLGLNHRLISGLEWVFAQVERAIILEDDCLPDPSFFTYCEALLERYSDSRKVLTIAGYNREPVDADFPHSYRFARTMWVWGWASWRDRFAKVDFTMRYWKDFKRSARLQGYLSQASDDVRKAWMRRFELAARGKTGWDFALNAWGMYRGMVHAVPKRSLVTNVGWDENATNTKKPDHHTARIRAASMAFPLRHPPLSGGFVLR